MDYSAFGKALKSEREKRSWDQAALAAAVKTKQQTVSRWENGSSRPREDMVQRLAELFGVDADDWLTLSGYQLSKPVQPLVQFLPLDKLSPENFELFCRDLVQKLHPTADVHRYGKQGHDQKGIDLYAERDGKKTDYQCKRHTQFGPEDVKQTIKDNEFEAEHHYLLLSRQASPGARDAASKHEGWTLWDLEDVSAKVRYLPKQDSLDLIDTYFPGWRKQFLGIDEPSPWLNTEAYFRPFNDRLRVFSHGWTFVGRKQELQVLVDFAKDKNSRALLLSGRGGVGKSRLLKAFADSIGKETSVRFMAQRSEPSPADLEILPQDGILIIEDAHEQTDLLSILSGIAIQKPDLKIIISTRPYGSSMIEDQLVKAGVPFNPSEPVTLGDMQLGDAKGLSLEILKNHDGDEAFADRIAEITVDCPLATVIGSRLVADGEIKPEVLNNSKKFRSHLLRSFRDIVTGQVGGGKDAEAVRELLDLIAVLQPIETEDPNFQEICEKLLGRQFTRVARDIRALEDAGVLLRRKNKLRIAPDLLADFIRAEATYDERAGKPSGYADDVFNLAKNDLATNLLVNLSQLDWRLASEGTQSEVLNSVWGVLKKQFIDSKIFTREAIIKALTKVAYYQPEQALEFVKIAMDNPTDEVEDVETPFMFTKPSYNSVINELPPILKYIAYHQDYLAEAADLLKELSKEDNRQPNQYPEHPTRILTELATIEPGKPASFVDSVVRRAVEWLESDTDVPSVSFDVLKAALATEGHQSEMSGIKLSLIPYKVRAEAVGELRTLIIDTAFDLLHKNNLPLAAQAVHVIEESLRGPWGNATSEEDKKAWQPEHMKTLKRLEKSVTDPALDPFILVEIRSAIMWHANFSKTETKQAAQSVLSAIPDTLDHQIARALADGWGWSFERSEDFKRNEEEFIKWRDDLAHRTIEKYKNDIPELIAYLTERIDTFENINTANGRDPGPFIGALARESSDFCIKLGDFTLEKTSSSLSIAFGIVIGSLAKNNYEKAMDFAESGLKSGDLMLARRTSRVIGWGLHDIPISDREMKLIDQITSHEDPVVRHEIVRAVRRIPQSEKAVGIEMLMSINVDNDEEVANEILSQFNKHGHYEVADLSEPQVKSLLDKLAGLKKIDGYDTESFVSDLSESYPEMVLDFVLARADHKAESDDFEERYNPIPYSWRKDNALKFSKTSYYPRALRKVRAWISEDPENWRRQHYGPEIFQMVSAGYDEDTINIIREWINSPNQGQLEAAASLLKEIDRNFLWQNSDFVIDLLQKAQKFGDKCYQRVSSWLHSVAIQGSRSGTPGQPFQEDIDQRDWSCEQIKKLRPGTPEYKFYKSLYNIAIANIKRDTIDEEDLFED